MMLAGRRAVVTGAGGNLGQAVLAAFLAEGARVVAVGHSDHDTVKIQAIGAGAADRCTAVRADVATEEGVGALLAAATEFFGAAEILVNLVGGFQGGKNLWELTLEEWQGQMDLNLTSAFLCCRAFIPGMIEGGYGRIVNVSSRAAFSLRAGTSAYAVSKAGVAVLTQVLREELKGTGVSVTAIVPSTIDTPANREAMPKADFSKWVTPSELARGIVQLCTEPAGLFSGGLVPAWGGV